MNKEVRDRLRVRAIAMAEEPEQKIVASATIEVIMFTLALETYGIESSFVKEVCPLKDFTPIPAVPAYILGIINLRGQIVTVIDLKKLFSFPEKGFGELNKVIIIHNEHMEFGILADVVLGTKLLALDEIMLAPATVTGIGEEFLKGVTKENLIVLNAWSLLSDENIVINDEVI